MIFWISVILLALGIAPFVAYTIMESIYDEEIPHTKFTDFCFWVEDFMCPISLFTITIAFISFSMLVYIIGINVSADAERAFKEQQYQALVYKAQTESIRDEFGIVNKEYVDEIQTWNQELAKDQAYSHNFWVGVFYPKKIYDGLEFVDWESIKMKE